MKQTPFILSVCFVLAACGCKSQEEPPDQARPQPQPSGHQGQLQPDPEQSDPLLAIVTPESLTSDEEKTAYALAILDAEQTQPVVRAQLNRYKLCLRKLCGMYNTHVKSLAGMTIKVQEMLHAKGVDETCYNMMTGMRFLNAGLGCSYAELLAAYSILREKGQTHDDAVAGLSGLLDGLEANRKELGL
jgi:hypothetical protein